MFSQTNFPVFFVHYLQDITSDEAILAMLEKSECVQLVDRSGWSVGKTIRQNSKVEFVNQLLAEEPITKRITVLEKNVTRDITKLSSPIERCGAY